MDRVAFVPTTESHSKLVAAAGAGAIPEKSPGVEQTKSPVAGAVGAQYTFTRTARGLLPAAAHCSSTLVSPGKIFASTGAGSPIVSTSTRMAAVAAGVARCPGAK